MSNTTSQDEDPAEDEIPKAKASIHSDEASEEETEEEEGEEGESGEEDEDTAPLSGRHQLVRSRESPIILLSTTPMCRLHSIHPKSRVPQPPPLNPISG